MVTPHQSITINNAIVVSIKSKSVSKNKICRTEDSIVTADSDMPDFVNLPALAFSIIWDQLSQTDKASYAMTCKRNARTILNDNHFWKKITLFPESNMLDLPLGWVFDEVVAFDLVSTPKLEAIAMRSKLFRLWSPQLKNVLKYLMARNDYRGPARPINLRVPEKRGYYTMKQYINSWKDPAFADALSSQALVHLSGLCQFVAIPCLFNAGASDLMETLAFPGISAVTLVNSSGWNEDVRSRRVNVAKGDLTRLHLTESELVVERDKFLRECWCEPAAWYEDFVTEARITSPITWAKLFEAYLRVKSGRNEGWYELLISAEIQTVDRCLVIELSFDHGSKTI